MGLKGTDSDSNFESPEGPASLSTGLPSSSMRTASTIFVFRSMKSGQSSCVRSITRELSFIGATFFERGHGFFKT